MAILADPMVTVSADDGRPRLSKRASTGGPGEPEVFVADEQNDVDIDVVRWMDLAGSVLRAEGVRGHVEMSLLFVDQSEITGLNAEFMGEHGPTDVLSFPIDGAEAVDDLAPDVDAQRLGPGRSEADRDDIPVLLGDVVVCPAVARAQAPTHGGTLDDELALLVVHGVLHLLGHDHDGDEERDAMWARQRELLVAHHWHGPAPAVFDADHLEP
jgi:probable rRNA maturation factor